MFGSLHRSRQFVAVAAPQCAARHVCNALHQCHVYAPPCRGPHPVRGGAMSSGRIVISRTNQRMHGFERDKINSLTCHNNSLRIINMLLISIRNFLARRIIPAITPRSELEATPARHSGAATCTDMCPELERLTCVLLLICMHFSRAGGSCHRACTSLRRAAPRVDATKPTPPLPSRVPHIAHILSTHSLLSRTLSRGGRRGDARPSLAAARPRALRHSCPSCIVRPRATRAVDILQAAAGSAAVCRAVRICVGPAAVRMRSSPRT